MARTYTAGDVVVAKFPYTDKEDCKVRNFLVIAQVNSFVWGVMMSSMDSIGQDDGSLYSLKPAEMDFTPLKPTGIRMNVIQTVSVGIIIKSLGRVNQDCLDRVLAFVKAQFPASS
ncbi:MAG: hypothetical protein K1X81_06010 [Bacteroidia bacterium]|nr:hypothetical protein [Bacteroidia bacterium]